MIGKTSGVRVTSKNLLQTLATFFKISFWLSIVKIFTKTSFGKSKMFVTDSESTSFNWCNVLEMLATAIFTKFPRELFQLLLDAKRPLCSSLATGPKISCQVQALGGSNKS